jgi:hypothetical protein
MVDYYRSLTGGEDDPELVRELGQLDEALREVWEP